MLVNNKCKVVYAVVYLHGIAVLSVIFLLLLDRIARTTYVDAVCCYRPSSVLCQSVTLVSPSKTAEPIEMPFGLLARMGPRNHVLDGVPDPPWEGAILGKLAARYKV